MITIVSNLLFIVCVFLTVLACSKKVDPSLFNMKDAGALELSRAMMNNKIQMKPISLGISKNFSVLAYSTILSKGDSRIDGKIGLMPGVREMIYVKESEVEGGGEDILGSDDQTEPLNYLSLVRTDMVTSYKEAASRAADLDKINLYGGRLGGQTLIAGIYVWDQTLSISGDVYLEGDENSIWIFQIKQHLIFDNFSKIHFLGNGKSENVFWQVAGSISASEYSRLIGTFMAQQFISLGKQTQIIGHAFVKNGDISMDQAQILLP